MQLVQIDLDVTYKYSTVPTIRISQFTILSDENAAILNKVFDYIEDSKNLKFGQTFGGRHSRSKWKVTSIYTIDITEQNQSMANFVDCANRIIPMSYILNYAKSIYEMLSSTS
jgi:hypothetical protein